MGTAQGKSWVRGSSSIPPGKLPLWSPSNPGALGPGPCQRTTGTNALLPGPLQAISRHKILRAAKSQNTVYGEATSYILPTPQNPGALWRRTQPRAGPPFSAANTASPPKAKPGFPLAGLGDTLQRQACQGGCNQRHVSRRPAEATPMLAFTGNFLHLGLGHCGLDRSCWDGAG